jgi:mono/diheme cytochrome c family protein
MKNGIGFIATLTFVSILASCAYNKEQLPAPDELPIDPNAPVITYTSHAKAIIDNNCRGCHGASGGVALENYGQVKNQADAGRILARSINGTGSPMPPIGLMPQATRDTLQMWLDQGALE